MISRIWGLPRVHSQVQSPRIHGKSINPIDHGSRLSPWIPDYNLGNDDLCGITPVIRATRNPGFPIITSGMTTLWAFAELLKAVLQPDRPTPYALCPILTASARS